MIPVSLRRSASGRPLAELVDDWLFARLESGRLRPSSAAAYRSVLRPLAEQLGEQDVETVAPARWLLLLRAAGESEAVRRKRLRALRALFNWGVRAGLLARSPLAAPELCERLPSTAALARDRPPLRDEDVQRLIDCADTEARRLAIALAAVTGLDRGHIVRLRADDLDPAERAVRIRRQKTGTPLAIPLPAWLWDRLRPLVEAAGRGRVLPGLSRQRAAADWWTRCRRRAGLPAVLFRDLRSYAAGRLARAGAPLHQVQRLLGHASPETTLRHYLPVDPEARRYMDSAIGYRLSTPPAAIPSGQ